ncbi:MAG TPA: cation:proton antiporter [Chloroflexota bacterium]|nr:cation:proton antiporter [Chloroflexota bacterium]
MTLTNSGFEHFLVAFVVLLLTARGLGEGARRLGQPSVIGEILAGIVLGPSLLGWLFPSVSQWLFPANDQSALLLQLIAQLGVILLLLLSGMETNLEIIRREARPAAVVAAGGILVPFLGGVVLALLLPSSLLGQGANRGTFALFFATALAMSAIPVIVKILLDLDLLRRDVGQLILSVGMLTDSIGWFLLALVARVAATDGQSVAALGGSLLGTVAFAAFSFTIGGELLRRFLAWVDHRLGSEDGLLAVVFAVGLFGAALTLALGVEAFLGAFLVGVMLARVPRVQRRVRPQLDGTALGVFAPFFFATAGLRVDLTSLLKPDLLVLCLVVIGVASVGKLIGVYVGARLAGREHWLAIALGAGLNARGAVEIVVALIGLELGILTPTSYAMIVVMAVATSLFAPPLLRWALKRVPTPVEEEKRLQREALDARGFLGGLERILVPVRDGRFALQAGAIVGHLAEGRELDALALHVRNAATRTRPLAVAADGGSIQAPSGPSVNWSYQGIVAEGVGEAILAEARRGYDLLVLGAPARPGPASIFGRVVDEVAAVAPCPVFVLRLPAPDKPLAPRWLILPIAGTDADRSAAEFALALARGIGASVMALHVVELDPLRAVLGAGEVGEQERLRAIGETATARIQALGDLHGVAVEPRVVVGEAAASEILAQAAAGEEALILLGARRRLAGNDLACGRTVEEVVRRARCPVAVLFPDQAP